ncbi:MAG: ABC-F family ATP-binding cassette domain-containing protein, partial [Myxococcales bacterium]|nr:ABC-F family ATP-binding cassette domain-containing protein [Myxococcales bacterium]
SGKTTLLRLVAGDQSPDGGEVRTARGVRVGWLPQDIEIEGGRTLLDLCTGSVPGRAEIEAELGRAEAAYTEILEAGDEEEVMDAAARLADLHERIAHFETTFSEHEAKRILAGLGFTDADHGRDIGEFSGGWKMRAVLASLLFQRPDVLLLDEPTNHLDMPSVAWFSAFLQTYRRPFVLISHDREFLNEQINRVVSLEVEGVRQFSGNYEQYVVQRAEEEVILENKATNLEREREKAMEFITRFRAKASKAKAVQSRIKALEKMESVETYRKRRVMSFSFPKTDRPGHEIVRVEHLRKAYGDHVVLPDVSLTVYRGDRIGIIGPNGAGKTTLLKLIAGEIQPSGGAIEIGHKVTPSYYAQHHAELLHEANTVYDEAAEVNRELGQTRVRTVLGSFLFSGDDVEKKVAVLSGGERARVALAKLLLDPGNLLLLDEPTNHLDLESCESLVETLDTYDGTMIFVSHNRALVRKLATKIWAVEGGEVTEYPGNLDDYMRLWRARYEGEDEPPPTVVEATGTAGPSAPSDDGKKKRSREDEKKRKREEAERRQSRAKTVGKLEKKVEELFERIDALESAQKERNDRLCDPNGFASDGERFEVLTALQVDAAKIDELTMRWETAQEELEAAQAALASDDA